MFDFLKAFCLAGDATVAFSDKLAETTLSEIMMKPSTQLKECVQTYFLASLDAPDDLKKEELVDVLASVAKISAYCPSQMPELTACFLGCFHARTEECNKYVKWAMGKLRESGPETLLRCQSAALQQVRTCL